MINFIRAGFVLIIAVMVDVALLSYATYLRAVNSRRAEIPAYAAGICIAITLLIYFLMRLWW